MTTPFTQLPIITDLTLRLISDPHHEHALQIDFLHKRVFRKAWDLFVSVIKWTYRTAPAAFKTVGFAKFTCPSFQLPHTACYIGPIIPHRH